VIIATGIALLVLEIKTDGVLAAGDAQLPEDRAHEGVHRGGLDAQAWTDLLGDEMLRRQGEDLSLTARKPVGHRFPRWPRLMEIHCDASATIPAPPPVIKG
jgi:hypothetical protein